MSSAGISFGGLASGLDTKAIITALVAVERRPINALEGKKTSFNRQKTLFGDLGGLLDKLTTAAKALKTTTDFLSFKATSDDESVLKATASNTAVPGTYTARVEQLAQAEIRAGIGQASASATLTGFTGAGLEFDITVGGNPKTIVVTENASLNSIAAAINAEDDRNDIGVRAEVVDTGGSGATRYQLVLSAKETGSAGQFSVLPSTTLPPGSQIDQVFSGLAGAAVTDAQDARIRLSPNTAGTSGIVVTRSSNEITDLWPGISVDLLSVPSPNKNITVTVTNDTEAAAKKVQDFVDAYNKIVDFATAQNALDANGKASAPLFGDSTLRSLRSNLRGVVGGQVDDTGNTAFQLLTQVGVTSDRDGKLTLDKSKLTTALTTDTSAVTKLFTGSTKGIATKLIAQLDVYTDSTDGLLKSRADTFGRQIKDTQSRIDAAETRLTTYQKQLEVKYSNLESLLAKLQSQGSSVNNIGR